MDLLQQFLQGYWLKLELEIICDYSCLCQMIWNIKFQGDSFIIWWYEMEVKFRQFWKFYLKGIYSKVDQEFKQYIKNSSKYIIIIWCFLWEKFIEGGRTLRSQWWVMEKVVFNFYNFNADKAFAFSGLNLAWVISPHNNINKIKHIFILYNLCREMGV